MCRRRCSFGRVDGFELYRLGRRLAKLGERTLRGSGAGPFNAGVRAILEDLVSAPGSSIRHITERTGFPQSHVSTVVAKLRDAGLVRTRSDPADGRRTLAWVTEDFHRGASDRKVEPIETVLAEALHTTDPEVLAEVTEAMELLAGRLLAGPISGANDRPDESDT